MDENATEEPEVQSIVTLLDVAEARLGRPARTGGDFEDAGIPMFGGCETCHASVAAYNAAPTRSGYIRCVGCVPEGMGFATVVDFETWQSEQESK